MSLSQRQKRADRLKADRRRTTLIWTAISVSVLGMVGLILWNIFRPAEGQAVPTAAADHVAVGEDPGEYNSNPPTSGPHYSSPLPAGFYEESDLEAFAPYPLGYAVHSLEHGYIVFWYNCDLLSEAECGELKTGIREYLDSSLVEKLIAYPWSDSDVPLVLTSWGYMLEMPEFDAGDASAFISANRLRAPGTQRPLRPLD